MNIDDPEAPKIEFPCDYPIKILGRQVAEFETVVLEVVKKHAPQHDSSSIALKESSKGTFVSLSLMITATGKDQLEAMHRDLLATGLVQMVI